MKKLFMAMMAVLVMASCGSNDGGNSNGAGGKSVGTSIATDKFLDEGIVVMQTFIDEAGQALDANDPAKYVAVYEKYMDGYVGFMNKMYAAMEGEALEEHVEKYKDKYEKLLNLYAEVGEVNRCAKNDLQFTSWQERKIAKADERMKEAVEKFSDEPGGTIERIDYAEGIDKIIAVTETLLNKAEQATRCNNPEIFVSAFEVFVDEVISIKNNYGDALSKMSPEEQQKHADKIQKMQKLLSKANNLDDILNPLQPSASQTRRLENAMKKMQNAN